MEFFERLVAETAGERDYLLATPQIRDGLLGKISQGSYLAYLAEAYHHVRHTVSLLSLARDKLPPNKANLAAALDEYIAEETGHEEWILDDITNAGGDGEAVRNGAPRLETELMVAYAYDSVGRVNPASLFGMIFVLESTSVQLAGRGANALADSLQLPENCFRYFLSHGTLDVDHMKFFQRLMSQVQDCEDQAAIIHMAKTMFILYGGVFRSIPHVV
jgi:hypothetical protein